MKHALAKLFTRRITFSQLEGRKRVYLYAGDVPSNPEYREYIGLSLTQWNSNHIKHDVTHAYPISDSTIDRYQAEDVFEHVNYEALPQILNEIYRILKPGGLFRLSLPDYQCDILKDRTQKNERGDLVFDPQGGGRLVDGQVTDGGHVWFPTYIQVKRLLDNTRFSHVNFLHYYDHDGEGVTHTIDYSKGFVMRTPDNDSRVKAPYRPMSIVVDCIKTT